MWAARSPLLVSGDTAIQDPFKLSDIFLEFLAKGAREGCRTIGVSVYRGSVLAWSVEGKPLTSIVTWMDRRTLRVYDKLPLPAKLASKLPLIGNVFRPGSPALVFKMLYSDPLLKSSIARGTAFLWTLDSYLAYLVSRRFVADVAQAALTGIINPYTLEPLGIAIRLLGLKGLRLPELLDHRGSIGGFMGVKVGPLIADQQAASIALGCLREDCIKVTLGTGVFVDAYISNRAPRRLGGGLIPVILFKDGRLVSYGVEGFAAGVGLVYETLAKAVGGFERIEELASNEDAKPVLFIPVLAGLRTPYMPYLQGAALGLQPGFSPASLVRGLIAGTAMLVKHVVSLVEAETGSRRSIIRLGGGLSRLRPLVSAIASAMGRSVERSLDHNDSARGAALLAAYSEGLISRRTLLNPPIYTSRVEPEKQIQNLLGDEEAWLKILGVLGSRRFSRLLERALGRQRS